MKVEYSNRATADLRKVSADAHEYGEAVTAAVEARIRAIVAHIAEHPEASHCALRSEQTCMSFRWFDFRIKSFIGGSMTA